jgi:anthranilate synthase component I
LKVTPTLEHVLAHAGGASHATVSVELLIDTETPISLYEKLARDEPLSFLLESAEGGETFGRYSFIGFDPARTFRFTRGSGVVTRGTAETLTTTFDDPLDVLASLLKEYRVEPHPELPRFVGGAVGYLGYDCVRYFENVPIPSGAELGAPEGYFLISERLVIVDHLKHRVYLVDHVPLGGDRRHAYAEAEARLRALVDRLAAPAAKNAAPFALGDAPSPVHATPTMTPADYCGAVERAKEAIRAGEIFQVVLSQRFTVDADLPSFELYRALRALNPSPYMFHIALGDFAVVGASPEVLVRLDRGEVLLRPIAGTRPRGLTPAEDERLERELAGDEKELAEHRMLLDLGRNDVGRIAEIGSVVVARPLHTERYSHVMHLVSDVRARLANGMSAFDVLRACFPAGTVSGAPKIRAMEIIAGLERSGRGLYSGAVGYFDFAGNMDTCIAIRSMIVERGRITLQAGAGIVHDSVPEKEQAECLNKAKGPLAAIALAQARKASSVL